MFTKLPVDTSHREYIRGFYADSLCSLKTLSRSREEPVPPRPHLDGVNSSWLSWNHIWPWVWQGAAAGGGSLNFGRKEKHAGQEHSYIVRVIIWLLANSWSPERQRGEGLVKISSVFFSANTTRKNGNQLSWQSFCLPVIEAFMILKNVYKDTSTWVSCEWIGKKGSG